MAGPGRSTKLRRSTRLRELFPQRVSHTWGVTVVAFATPPSVPNRSGCAMFWRCPGFNRNHVLLDAEPSARPPNVLTLSCKSRLTRLPQEAARRLPRPTRSGRSEMAADVPRACSSSRPRRLAAGPTDRRLLSACEGSWAARSCFDRSPSSTHNDRCRKRKGVAVVMFERYIPNNGSMTTAPAILTRR